MNQLIPTPGQKAKMSSREIAELMGKRHDHVLRDVKSLISQGAICAPNFGETSYEVRQPNGSTRSLPMYLLDFDATMTLITGYDAKRRSMVIKRWRELETGKAVPVAFHLPDFNDPIAAARAWADAKEAERKALAEGEAARRQIELDRPKVNFANAIAECEKAIRFEQFAKAVHERFRIGRNRLYAILRDLKVLRFNNEPYQEYMERGWFRQVEKTYINPKTDQAVPYFLTLITGKGQVGIFKLLDARFGREAANA